MKKQTIINILLKMSEEINDIDYIDQLMYIFTLLFLKVNMDTNEYKNELYEIKYTKFAAERLMEKQPIILKNNWRRLYRITEKLKFGNLLNDYLEDLEQKNICLRGLFSNIDFSKIPYRKLTNMMEMLNYSFLAIKNEEDRVCFNNAIEEFIFNSKFENRFIQSSPGTNFTPLTVADLISKLIDVKENEEVGDLVCGSGGLLLNSIKYITNKKVQIYAQDKDHKILQFCRLNMLLHGIYDAKIRNDDTINKTIDGKFDVIVANPPFSTQNDIKKSASENDTLFYNDQFPYGIPPASKSDYAFIQRMLQALKANGRMASIISLGALFRGEAEEEIRKNLLKDNIIETVILLPQNMFRNTSIKACIIIFNKNKLQSDVLFVNASKLYKKGKYRNEITKDIRDEIVNAVNNRKTKKGISYLASLKEILENDGNLSVTRYVEEENIEDIDIQKLKEQIIQKEKELMEIKERKLFYENRLKEV